ncbi:arylsulfatase [Flavobacteriaceae bacterium UJ101]|nr:arylsulfatase [Flavobacteriaceae bacterium UJ101]
MQKNQKISFLEYCVILLYKKINQYILKKNKLLLFWVLFLGMYISYAQKKPNIVFMLTDNLGYGDIGVYGGGEVRGAPTPNIDQLATEGLQLTNFNVEPECTPTRSALMTGRMPIRSGTSKVPLPGLPQGLIPWEYTIAELLRDSGYQSALYGKWHLGDVEDRYPTGQGFDEWFGFPHSSAESAWDNSAGFDSALVPNQGLWEGKKGEKSKRIGDYNSNNRGLVDEMITDRSVAYIEKHAKDDKPFFLYVPFSLPHSPPLPNPKYAKKGKSNYQNVLMEIDYNTGRIIDAIEKMGITDNTIIVWASDNGPETLMTSDNVIGGQSDSGPFRGEFPSGWEGAIRTPCIIKWKGNIPEGRKSNEIVSMLDFYSTFAHIVDAEDKIPTDRAMDSFNMLNFFTGRVDKSPREFALYFHGDDLLSVKWRNYKVHNTVVVNPSGPVYMAGQSTLNSLRVKVNYDWIFDIENDPKELWNVNAEYAWVGVPVAKIVSDYVKSIKKYPNIKPGDSEKPKKGK